VGVKLVALDIDGTVIPPDHGGGDHSPPAAVREAVRKLTAAGIPVVLASGRMFPGTVRVARELRLITPLVCQQGCSVHRIDGEMLHVFPIERRLAVDIINFARERGLDYEWFNPVRYIASRPSAATRRYGEVSGIEPEYRPDPEFSGVVPTGVGIISDAEQAGGIHRELVGRYGERLHVLDFPEVTVAVAPEANKGHALSLICADYGIDRDDVVAVGDSVNDAAMLAWAGLGAAMAHADPYARDAADLILEPGEDALAAFLVSLVL
jgi:Cof subfamily protein (haloacid dehalogenase superfamily)